MQKIRCAKKLCLLCTCWHVAILEGWIVERNRCFVDNNFRDRSVKHSVSSFTSWSGVRALNSTLLLSGIRSIVFFLCCSSHDLRNQRMYIDGDSAWWLCCMPLFRCPIKFDLSWRHPSRVQNYLSIFCEWNFGGWVDFLRHGPRVLNSTVIGKEYFPYSVSEVDIFAFVLMFTFNNINAVKMCL